MQADTMHAVRMHATGSPDVLVYENAPEPAPGHGEILIRVHAAGVNPVDCKARLGVFPPGEHGFPVILGREVSGRVAACGPGVRDIAEGEPVIGMLRRHGGGYAEYAVAAAGEYVRKPDTLEDEQAAAIPLAGLTAWQGLFDHGELEAGQTVLILGAGGGVGHFAVQFAREHGARVLATAAAEDLDFVRQLGAEIVVDHAAMPFERVVGGVDLVLDLVAGAPQRNAWRVLNEGGTVVSTVGRPDRPADAPEGTSGCGFAVRVDPGELEAVRDLIERGKVAVVVRRRLPLAEARHAHELMETEHNQGKTVLVVRE